MNELISFFDMSIIQLAVTDPEYKQGICNIEKRFPQQQIKAAAQVNSSKIEFYWSLGRDICEMHVEECRGESVTKQLSEDLRLAIDETKGLTPVNLYYRKRLDLSYNQFFLIISTGCGNALRQTRKGHYTSRKANGSTSCENI